MPKRKGVSNTEILEKRQWYSKIFGWIDITQATDGYFTAIYQYWFFERRPQEVNKYTKDMRKLIKNPTEELDNKTKRQKSVIAMYDSQLNQEYIKREMAKRFDV